MIVDSLVIAATAERLLSARANVVLLLHMIPEGDESLIEALYRRSRIVVTGDSTLTCLRERLASDGVDAVKIEPGVPAHWRSKRRYADTARQLLTVANYIDGKGIERVLDVLLPMKELPWSWTVYGNTALDPSYFGAVAHKAAAYGLSDRVKLLGPISHDAVNEQMVASDLVGPFLVPRELLDGHGRGHRCRPARSLVPHGQLRRLQPVRARALPRSWRRRWRRAQRVDR